MKVIINGEEKSVEADSTIFDLLKSLKIENKVMAAAVNMNIIKKEDWKTFIVKENSKIEFLHFVGGG